MKNTLQETMQQTDKDFDDYLNKTHGFGKSQTEHATALAHITFEHTPHHYNTIMTHGILEIQAILPPNEPHSIMLLHTTGTVQIIGEALETLVMHLRNMQVHYLATGKHESGGVVQKIVVNGGEE